MYERAGSGDVAGGDVCLAQHRPGTNWLDPAYGIPLNCAVALKNVYGRALDGPNSELLRSRRFIIRPERNLRAIQDSRATGVETTFSRGRHWRAVRDHHQRWSSPHSASW